jgi:hypothetical protein
MNHPKATRQKIRQNKHGKSRTKNTELMRHSATNCLLQLYTQVFRDYIGGI